MSAGNEWTLHALASVILAGVLCATVPMVLKCLLHDRHALGDESEAVTIRNTASRHSLARAASAAQLGGTNGGTNGTADRTSRRDASNNRAPDHTAGSHALGQGDGAKQWEQQGLEVAQKAGVAIGKATDDAHALDGQGPELLQPLLPGGGTAECGCGSECGEGCDGGSDSDEGGVSSALVLGAPATVTQRRDTGAGRRHDDQVLPDLLSWTKCASHRVDLLTDCRFTYCSFVW